jgi:hypothetical protein
LPQSKIATNYRVDRTEKCMMNRSKNNMQVSKSKYEEVLLFGRVL